jgi:hypothetical protein
VAVVVVATLVVVGVVEVVTEDVVVVEIAVVDVVVAVVVDVVVDLAQDASRRDITVKQVSSTQIALFFIRTFVPPIYLRFLESQLKFIVEFFSRYTLPIRSAIP